MRCSFSFLRAGACLRIALVSSRSLCAVFVLLVLSISCATSFASEDAGSLNEGVQQVERVDVQKRIVLALSQYVDAEKLTHEEAKCIRVVVEIARMNSLPMTVLEEKIQEGFAKNIDGLLICAALEKIVDNLQFSKIQLSRYGQGVLDEYAIQITADTLLQGVSREQLTAFLSSYGGHDSTSLSEALRLFALLKQSGVTVPEIKKFIAVVLKDENDMARWKELPQLLALAKKHGASPSGFMQQAVQAVEKRTPPHEFARQFSLTSRSIGFADEE